MSEHILDLLAKRKQNSLKRKETFKKMKAEELDNKESSVKRILGGENQYSAVPVKLTVLRDLYFTMLRAYTGNVQYYSAEMSDGQVALWMRVEKARCKTGCDPERYIKAQFVFFDRAFKKAPIPKQLATDSAVERAIEFEGETMGRVLSHAPKADISRADVFRESEKLLQRMMVAQKCNREEFYRKFVVTGVYLFPEEFLKADPAYKKVIEG